MLLSRTVILAIAGGFLELRYCAPAAFCSTGVRNSIRRRVRTCILPADISISRARYWPSQNHWGYCRGRHVRRNGGIGRMGYGILKQKKCTVASQPIMANACWQRIGNCVLECPLEYTNNLHLTIIKINVLYSCVFP